MSSTSPQSRCQVSFLEKGYDSITLIWKSECLNVKVFELQMKTSETDWQVLSSNLVCPIAKKKNLVKDLTYIFRVRILDSSEIWGPFSNELSASVLDPAVQQMPSPSCIEKDSSSVTIVWPEIPGTNGYKIRYRTGESDWNYVDSILKGCSVRKKGLSVEKSYYFAVMPVFLSDPSLSLYDYSPSSLPMQVARLSSQLSNILPSDFLSPTGSVSAIDALAGKAVAIYFSAHWCGPCRNYTPQLAEFYKSAKSAHKPFEIIFCSADHNESEFSSYYMSHPWLAVRFGAPEREALQSLFNVSGIPRLVVMGPTGRIVCENAVQISLNLSLIDSWVSN